MSRFRLKIRAAILEVLGRSFAATTFAAGNTSTAGSRKLASASVAAAACALATSVAFADTTTLRDCATAEASPGNVDHGETKSCGASNGNGFPWVPPGQVNCAIARVKVPAEYRVVKTERGISNNPRGVGLDWAMWRDDINVSAVSGGGFEVSTQLQNWATFPRNACLVVTIESR